ncbi:hypothetical protein ACFQZX_07460 [Mucilaginibacter litoreus]|uniref:Uncharacterized protein n=1 Tax=Mucilaginibacter litoreus TaxID=1048221 RepID=A0ABW3AQW4_9SPHI
MAETAKDTDEVLRIVKNTEGRVMAFALFRAYDIGAPSLGRILFDENGYWIYDGEDLSINEQEQMAGFILKTFYNPGNVIEAP